MQRVNQQGVPADPRKKRSHRPRRAGAFRMVFRSPLLHSFPYSEKEISAEIEEPPRNQGKVVGGKKVRGREAEKRRDKVPVQPGGQRCEADALKPQPADVHISGRKERYKMDFSLDKAKALLDSGIAEAQELIREPSKVDDVLIQLEDKLKEVPAIGETLSDLPLMISMVKGYITKEYNEVSPKVIATMVAAFLYLIKKKDIISDKIPVIGMVDDLAVLGLALKLSEPELEAFRAFRNGKRQITQDIEAEA